MARIRTLDFLPEVFQTPSNAEFLAATLDQIVNPPNNMRIQGYIGSKFGYGVNAKDYYVVEPTKTRRDYQLEPGVVFTKPNESVAQDFITYPGIIDGLKIEGGITDNNSTLFESQFYSWDSFTNLDKLINFNEYYWLPIGPPAVTVATNQVFSTENYLVTSLANEYNIVPIGEQGQALNPTITMLRGGTYTFAVNQDSQFWIQTEPGVSGTSATQPNIPTRNVFGVTNNGANDGVVTFNVPTKDAQNEYDFPGNNIIDVVSTLPFDQVNATLLSTLIAEGGVDGITSLDGLRIMFYNTGVPSEVGYISSYYDEVNYDENNPIIGNPVQTFEIAGTTRMLGTYDEDSPDIETYDQNTPSIVTYSEDYSYVTLASGYSTDELYVNQTITFNNPTFGGIVEGQLYFITDILNSTDFIISESLEGESVTLSTATGTMTMNVGQGLYEQGFYSVVAENYYRVTYVGNPDNPVIRLLPDGVIPTNQRITPRYGAEWVNRGFYRNLLGVINLIPPITAPLDTLYYQDSVNPNKVGIIRLIDNNINNSIDVERDILGKVNYTAPNGVVFTNGLKVLFDGNIFPAQYRTGEYYVEGVGTSIELVPTSELVCPEGFTLGAYVPWDTTGFDIGNFDSDLFIPVDPDYITIARNSISKNAWSRSNRWFHVDVINATAQYNNNPNIANEYATENNKAKRPIIEFYPNLKLFNSGVAGKQAIDFIDTRATDALSTIPGNKAYYPDVETYTAYTATINGASSATTTTFTVEAADVTGTFQIGMYVADEDGVLPTNTQITNITGTTTLTITVEWDDATTIAGVSDVSIIGTDTTVNNYALFPGARIVFTNDADANVADKIYVADLVQLTPGSDPVITLELAEDSNVFANEQVAVLRGYNYQGYSFYYTGVEWIEAQQKVTVNQAPLFDIFDANNISFGDTTVYRSSSFTGNKLFAYGIGSGPDDPILGFPVRYSSVDNVGDISFDVSLNLDTFDYVSGTTPITQKVNTGYVYNYTSPVSYIRELGWQTAVAPSTQYQLFEFTYTLGRTNNYFTCDVATIAAIPFGEQGWPRVQVYVNNIYQEPTKYQVYGTENSTTIILNSEPTEDTVIQILLLSDQVSKTAYYTIPNNLNNNPFNEDITSANIGDIRSQYRDIFINAPNTSGQIFGANNFRDLGNLVPYGTSIIQNSASLALPGTFLRKQDHNLFNALMFNSREYIKFKQLLVYTVQNSDYTQRFTPSTILDDALDQITAAKSQTNAFFWSDMLPSKAPYRSNTYTFANSLSTSIYPLSQVYDFSKANYNGVLVYLSRTFNGNTVEKQLTRGVDYTISTDSPSLTITLDLQAGDKVTIKEYNQTYGSYVPNTPTKLGLYQAYQPSVVLDSDYTTPTYFIKGHDGSYTKLYGDYIPETDTLIDFRDQALLEFEKRVYNNIKLSTIVPIQEHEVIPGYFRDSPYTNQEWLEMYSTTFLDWIGQNRLDYKTQFYNRNNEFTYNYTNSQNKLDRSPIEQGYWRGLYEYLYDTTTPNETPWEMLGFANEPTWWTARYGPAPYTSDNEVLWGDLEQGLVWNDGNFVIVPELARPGLTAILPVNSNGDLISPLRSVVGNYNPSTFQKDWKVGDMGPVELSYRRSSTWPFDLMRLFALTKPAQFYNLAVDLDNYKYNTEFNQYLVNDRRHLIISDVQIYGNGTAKTSYINWIVDYEKQQGIDATNQITTLLDNLDVRLVYRLAGYSDKTLLSFYVEKGSPNSRNASLLIPDESYSVLLYDNQVMDRLTFSGVIVQQVENGFTVYGNSQNFAYFTTLLPKLTGSYTNLKVQDVKVKITNDYYDDEVQVPYGTIFYSIQEVAQFLASYGRWLTTKGMIFENTNQGVEVNWELMIQEFMYWVQTGWELGSVITLNPAATAIKINKENEIIQPLTLQQQNFILNQDSYPIQLSNLCIQRDGTLFDVHPLNQGDALSYAQFNMSNFEHGIVFDNVTLFNDIIYNLVTGLRQNRITVRGQKTAEWNGTIDASGFVINQDNVREWSKEIKYTKGQIVKYKNKYWTALKIVEPSVVFDELSWKITDYNDIQKGLLPNASTRAYESTLYYDSNNANLENDADLLSFSLIGYRPRDYLALADLTDITQINVYKNLIRNKGTRNATLAFKGANLPQGGINYEIYENWAIKSGEFGGVENENFVEFRINQNNMTGNPSIVSLTNGVYTEGAMQEIPLYSLFNYARPPQNPNILNTIPYVTPSPLYPNAGYVNFNDVKMSSYYFAGLPGGVNASGVVVPIGQFYVRDYLWMANFKDKWGTFTLKPIGQVLQISGNINNTSTITFSKPHNLKKLDPIAIVNFAAGIDGYYLVSEVVSLNQVIINLTIPNNATGTLTGQGIGLTFQSQRVETPAQINTLDLLDAEFTKNTVWVDENNNGDWAVYRKSINYQNNSQLSIDNSVSFGAAVAYQPSVGYLISDPDLANVYRYQANPDGTGYTLTETLNESTSFGASIAYAQNITVISEPTTGTVYIYAINDSVLSDDLIAYQDPIVLGAGLASVVAISDDTNWIYISDTANAQVYVYRKQNINLTAEYIAQDQTYIINELGDTDFVADFGAIENKVGIIFKANADGIVGTSGTGTVTQITYTLSTIIDGTVDGATVLDDYSFSLTTDYDGDTVVVGAPKTELNGSTINFGKTYIYQRSKQNIEAQFNSLPNEPQILTLAWTPTEISRAVTKTVAGNKVRLSSATGISENDPIIFTGTGLTGTDISSGVVYYVAGAPVGNDIQLKTSRSSTTIVQIQAVDPVNNVTATAQTNPLYVYLNGTIVDDSNYAAVDNTLYYTGNLLAGDIVTVSDNKFTLVQTLESNNSSRANIFYGYALDVTTQGIELLVGSPFEIDSLNREGIVYRYTNAGSRYGVVIGSSECNITTNSQVLLNGFLVFLTPGDASHVANIINTSGVTNIEASYTADNKLIIQTINKQLGQGLEKLYVSVTDNTVLSELGIQIFTPTQTINCPHEYGPTQFGKSIKFNESDSVVIGAPVGTRYSATTFDFTDDENIDNDTVFDNNATRFVDQLANAGAVYMFDYLAQYNESLANVGAFVYAQSVNSTSLTPGDQPLYGIAVDFNDNSVIVGSPDFNEELIGGQAVIYTNLSGLKDWSVYRQSSAIVDIEKIQNSQLFSASTNNTLANLDYMDPLQNKLLGAVRSNIDFVSSIDPAQYNSIATQPTGRVWGAEQVGQIWLNTSNVRWVNYHQNDVVYNSKYWGAVFPGSDVAVFTWVASNVPPSLYEGPGLPFDTTTYAISSTLNASNVVVPVYYFWARNTALISERLGKTLSDNVIANYIASPQSSGIAYMAPVLPNTFAIYNSQSYFNANDTVFHIGYANGTTDDVAHNEFTLIRENYPDDFLPGLPESGTPLNGLTTYGSYLTYSTQDPTGLYARFLDSLSGADPAGNVVPNPNLPKAVQSGVLARPRQSFFFDRYAAVQNYLQFANTVLAQFPIAEIRPNATFLFAEGPFYNTTDYWEYVNWWATGYDDSTKSTIQVPIYADLSELNVPVNTLVTVEQNGAGLFEVYRYDGAGVWTRIGLQNGTIKFNEYLWDYSAAKLGFGGDFFDTNPYDQYPSEETRNIVRALTEQIYIGDLLKFRNESLIILFEYIQTETTESQNYLPWLSKTSLIDVDHVIRELKPYEVFKSDNQDFLSGYINEVKPYHVVVKEFVFKYTGTDAYVGDFTDFDVPATYNPTYQTFISPQLVYGPPGNEYQYSDDSPIWNTAPYRQWFQNKGVSIAGQPDFQITTLASYLSLGMNFIIVDNAQGFPVNGTIRIGEEELTYSYVDRGLNVLGGLIRGVNNTTIADHVPGEQIFIDLPPVIVLNGGNGYLNPPKVTAYIDTTKYPEPRVPAQLEAVMALDTVIDINVINPGEGYAVLPEIRIDSAYDLYFANTAINSTLHTIKLFAPNLRTGDLVQFKVGSNGVGVGRLQNNQWYYVNVLEASPSTIIALYSSYSDAINDHDRIMLYDNGSSTDLVLAQGARASAITSASPTRENNVKIKFDRTTYTSQVVDWESGAYYGSFFAGNYNNSQRVSSSSITLENVNPDISTILASAEGAVFEISNVENDHQVTWSSAIRYVAETVAANDSIKLVPQDGNNPDLSELEPNAQGTTVGFYTGMPIKFTGAVVGGLQDNVVYYVKDILDIISFTIADENGTLINLTNGTANLQGIECYVGEVVNTAVLTFSYPGILKVTATTASTNTLTVPISLIGTGGTAGFYPTLPIFFTDGAFGGITPNQTYYVTSVLDDETFTISDKMNALTATVTATTASTDAVTVSSTEGFNINDAIVFSGTTFGNINAGTIYYVSSVLSATQFTISATVNGTVVALTDDTGEATVTSQKDVTKLTTGTGNMTMNVSLPVSPGQVNGQLFTLYDTSAQYPNIASGDIGSLITRTVNATIGNGLDRIAISAIDGGTDFFYVNMPIRFNPTIDALTAGTTYYVVDYSGRPLGTDPETYVSNIQITATTTTSSGNYVICDSTDSLYEEMPIVFSGVGLGGIVIGQEYYVKNIASSTTFTISDSPGGTAKTLSTANGIMVGNGDPYIVVSASIGGSPVTLTTDNSGSELTQYITATPSFDISYILGGYRAIVSTPGSGFAENNTILISGTEIGGSTPANDLTLTVNTVGTNGEITDVICQGIVPSMPEQYYLKVLSPNTLGVYSDPLMQVPVSGIDFGFVGFTTATVTQTQAGPDSYIVVDDASQFAINDGVVFTGSVAGGIVAGNTYYIVDIASNNIELSNNPGGSPVTLTTDTTTDFTMAKAGSFALLPEPFYFNQSIVKFNNRVYVCVISNNDDEFIFGKWELLDSGDRRLNALDRTIGYYQPTVNMPGVDLTQLFDGVTYPNPIYLGNAFQPDQQYDIDTILQDQPFYPTEVDITSILYDGDRYIAPANFPTYTGTLNSAMGDTWTINKLTNAGVGVTDIAFNGDVYVMTSTNSATPVFRSNDGISWTTNGYFTPYGSLPYDTLPYDTTSISISALALNSVAYYNGYWIAVGDNIVRSSDTYSWTEVNIFEPALQNQLYGVTAVNIPAFVGAVAVGKGRRIVFNPNENYIPTNLILYSANGLTWTSVASLTPRGMYGVAANATKIVAVGEDGIIYYSENGANWFGVNEVSVISVNSSTNQLNVTNTSGFAVNDPVTFNNSFSSITAGTTYYIKTIVSPTQVELSTTPGGSLLTLTVGSPADQTLMTLDDAAISTLRDIIYADNTWMAVGDNGTIRTSTDAVTWTTQTSGTTEDLTGVTYNSTEGSFTVVGYNNVIISSTDNGVTWESVSLFTVEPTLYDVKGADFPYGYGPEELVPGVVTDNLAMIVTTSPGTTWDVTEYAHVGFQARSVELTPTSETQTVYSFLGVVENPAQISVQVLDATTRLGTTLLTSQYTINWLNKTVTLNTPLTFSPAKQSLRINVYQVGNGNQIVKESTDYTPIRTNSTTGFNEIYLNCNYSAPIYQGSGVIRTGTNSVTVRAVATDGVTNRITCDSVSDFVINNKITFQGVTFGNVQEETDYYVKSISYATNSITISDSYNPITGQAGPTFILSTATGEMYVNIQTGNPSVWTDPIVYHNGTQLVLGTTGIVTRTKASNNAITTSTTGGLIVGTPITFGNTMFGDDILPLTTYYIKSIVDGNEFTISQTPGGPTLVLTDGTGGSTFVTNDYAFTPQAFGSSAIMVFSTDNYNNDNDYIVYSLFGETTPVQYGFAVPQVQEFAGNGSTAVFNLDNFVGEDNEYNAIVEINGLRQTYSAYDINTSTNTITFFSPPPAGSTVSVLTYNDTNRQYLTTQYGITGNPGSSLTALVVGSTTNSVGTYDQDTPVAQTYDQDTPSVVLYDQDLYWLTLSSGSTSSLNVNDPIIFSATTIGGIVAGQTYYVLEILNATDFVISESVGGEPFQVTTASGSMPAVANGLTVAPISTITNTISPPIATTFATASSAASDEITVSDTTGFVLGQPVQFFGTTFGGIATDGTVYFIDTIVSATAFTISDTQGGAIKPLSDGSGNMQVVVGGTPAVRVTTSIENNFVENTLIRIDGTEGSIQLNNNEFYAKIISPYTFDLYTRPYDSTVGAVNYPVTTCSTYTGGGYTWRQGLFFLATTLATATATNGRITVTSTSDLVEGTPVYFSQIETPNLDVNGDPTVLMGGLVQAQKYYVKEVINVTQFTVSTTPDGSVVTFTSDTGAINVTQWAQEDVDRIWVTVNGLRVPSSKLRINEVNEVSILTEIVSGDEVIMTNMIPSATPNQEIYMNLVDAVGQSEVYRISNPYITWLTQPVYELSDTIYVNDVTKLTNQITQTVTTPTAVSGNYYIGLTADKNLIASVTVFNNTTNAVISPANYDVVIIDLTPTVKLKTGAYITVGDSLTITTLEGNTLYVNGEQIRFSSVDFTTNTVSNLQRGVNGTGKQYVIPALLPVYGLLSSNRMPDSYYNQTWNSYVYNTTLGDPLQISETAPAIFLNLDVS